MFRFIRTAIQNHVSRRKAENYRRGFDYAAGALIRREETPDSLRAKIWTGDEDEFDRGMLDAARELVRCGTIDDCEHVEPLISRVRDSETEPTDAMERADALGNAGEESWPCE
ncbi:MAG: hypothetical protein KJ558_10020 [Gammaproteobacteria bacterium]|nr:hypothetical protein [Gammaproteobacteria bacterium]MBU1959684.1 hypothetical protein [Gammaproteobacteria bacterium]